MTKKIKEQTDYNSFDEVYYMVKSAQVEARHQTNKLLIELYWSIGKYISEKITFSNWGKGVVDNLSEYLLSKDSGVNGFSSRNIWRMKKFYETYKDQEKLSALLTEISWSNHLHILSKTKTMQEKCFYIELATKHHYPERDFARIIDSGTFERTLLANQKLSALLTEFPVDAKNIFKDVYLFEFAGINGDYKEVDLQNVLLKKLQKFLLEMGPDFSFIGEQYLVQVGNNDYKIDLLLQHRELNCLVAVELKVTEFKPEYLGKLQFYLEALDQNVKKDHENPSIGLLICKTKDEEVVKYAMSRSVSPALIAEYETKLIDKKVLQEKIRDLKMICMDGDSVDEE